MRIFLSNLASNQFGSEPQQDGAMMVDTELSTSSLDDLKENIPGWTLKIQGRLLDVGFRNWQFFMHEPTLMGIQPAAQHAKGPAESTQILQLFQKSHSRTQARRVHLSRRELDRGILSIYTEREMRLKFGTSVVDKTPRRA